MHLNVPSIMYRNVPLSHCRLEIGDSIDCDGVPCIPFFRLLSDSCITCYEILLPCQTLSFPFPSFSPIPSLPSLFLSLFPLHFYSLFPPFCFHLHLPIFFPFRPSTSPTFSPSFAPSFSFPTLQMAEQNLTNTRNSASTS